MSAHFFKEGDCEMRMSGRGQVVPQIIKLASGGWYVYPGNKEVRTLKEAKQVAAQHRRGSNSCHEPLPRDALVKVECGWCIIHEERPGCWTQVVGPLRTREQVRETKKKACEEMALDAEHAERMSREEDAHG